MKEKVYRIDRITAKELSEFSGKSLNTCKALLSKIGTCLTENPVLGEGDCGSIKLNCLSDGFVEKDLENIITKTKIKDLVSSGLDFCKYHSVLYEQFTIGNYGVADIVLCGRNGGDILITVVELKKGNIDLSAFFQALRYAKGIQRFLELRGYKKDGPVLTKSFYRVKINIVLIGRELYDRDGFRYLTDLVPYDGITFYTYNLESNSISFEKRHSYRLSDEGFKKLKIKSR